MQRDQTPGQTLAPLYDAMMHVARLMADAAEAADWETLDAARDCAKLLTTRIDTAAAGVAMEPALSQRRYAVLRDVLRAVRIVRSQVLSLRELPMVETSRAIGTPASRIVVWHILPNTYSVLIAQATLFLAWAILDTAAMSFIGVGVHPPTPELGAMIAEGAQYIVSGEWWLSVFPGIFIAVLVIAFNLVGDGLRDRLDPRSRR